MSKRWVALVAAVATTGGCTKYIKVDRPVSEVEVRRFDDPPSIDENWSYDGNVVATAGTNDIALKIEAIRFKSCTTKTHRVVRKTEAADRHWDDSGSKEFFHWGSVLALGAMGLGLVSRYGFDNGLTKVGDDGVDTLSTTGWLTIFGGLTAAYVVPVAIGTDFLAINGSSDLGESDEVTSSTKRCQVGPAAGARVKVPGSEGTMNAAGVFEAKITNDVLAHTNGDSLVQVEGHEIASAELDAASAEIKKAQEEAEKQQRIEAAKALNQRIVDAEIKSGTCVSERQRVLQQVTAGFEQYFGGGMAGLVILDNAIVVAKPKAQPSPFTFGSSGTYHIFSIGFEATAISGGAGRSPYEQIFRAQTNSDVGSAMVSAGPSNHPAVSFTGRGCTLLLLTQALN